MPFYAFLICNSGSIRLKLFRDCFTAIQCPDPAAITNTVKTIVGVHYSLEVHYDCIDGYATQADTISATHERQTTTCQADGTWDITPEPCSHSEYSVENTSKTLTH